ncbi:MAG: NAD(P)(+) transhydrogenase (Re/Si-specific) subunit alpha, partial [Gammaproteobacteria bacterium]
MKVGVPKECAAGETRVAATPETAKKLISKGLEVGVERGAGAGARIPDADFEAAGVALVDAAEALAADIVLKVRRPSRDEAAKMSSDAILIALLDPCADDGTLKVLADGKV